MNKELRERIIKINRTRRETEEYLQNLNMHLCEHGIFTNDVDVKYMGTIGHNYEIESIKWN